MTKFNITLILLAACILAIGKAASAEVLHRQSPRDKERPTITPPSTIALQQTLPIAAGAGSDIPKSATGLVIRVGCDVSGSTLNNRIGRTTFNEFYKALTDALAMQDLFELWLFYDNKAFVTVAMSQWQAESKSAVQSVLDLKLRGGNRTLFSPVLSEFANRATTGDILALVTDGQIDAGTEAENQIEKVKINRVAAQLAQRQAQVVLIKIPLAKGAEDFQWLAQTLGAQVMDADQLHAGALQAFIATRRQPVSAPTIKPEPTKPATPFALRGRFIVTVVIAALVIAFMAVVMIRKLRKKGALLSPSTFTYAVRLDCANASEDFKTQIIEPEDNSITIGGSETDSFFRRGLKRAHIRLRYLGDIVKMECNAPVNLADGSLLEPFGDEPAIETFAADREVAFAIGDAIFVAKRITVERRGNTHEE